MKRSAPMKRTPFKRSSAGLRHIGDILPEAVAVLQRSGFASQWQPREKTERTITLQSIRVPAPSAPPPFAPAVKLNPLRSEQYRRYVASFPCFACGLVGSSQCAHANEGKGMAMKVCDRRSFPLCFRCHSNLDNSRGMTRDQRREAESTYVERMQAQARADRRPEFA